MNYQEVEALIGQMDKEGIDSAYLQVIKPLGWRPRNGRFKLRTALGLATILSVVEKTKDDRGYTSVAVVIKRASIERWLRDNKPSSLTCPNCGANLKLERRSQA